MDAHPLLWQYPCCLASRLWSTCSNDPVGVEHVLCFVHDVARRRLLRMSANRNPDRTRDSICRRVLWILGAVAAAHDPGTRWPNMLPNTIDRDGLIALIARTLSVYHANPRRRHRKLQTPTITDAQPGGVEFVFLTYHVPLICRVMLSFFRCCIADGVFEPHIPCNATLDEHRLDQALLTWENTDPVRFRATPSSVELRDRPNISENDLKIMQQA